MVGRLKDVIIKFGFNVYPREIETRIESSDGTRGGSGQSTDSLLCEAACACIVPVEGAIVTG
ncbi:uncharacterized protein METZ01_LOCUS156815 [marine metagenome]|uniref:Uncharacterized protein n=1 Tax=marine metagenome TaxID=408172 RepID=A0A382ARP6_9ZZZZ